MVTHKDIPNLLSWLRVLLVFMLVAAYLSEQHHLLAPIFIGAALTDWLDGFLARRWNVTSNFGAFLDPVADKLIVSAALIILVDAADSTVLLCCVLIIILREVAMSSLRHWASAFQGANDIPVMFLGKVKTASQLIAIGLLFLGVEYQNLIFTIGIYLLVLSAVTAIISFAQYCAVIAKKK